MIARADGYVVNIGSVAGNYALPGGNVYCGTKAFVNHLSMAMRAELIGKGVRVTSVEPGNTETEFSIVRFKGNEAAAKAVYDAKSGPRVACTGEDIAEIVYFATETLPKHVGAPWRPRLPGGALALGFSSIFAPHLHASRVAFIRPLSLLLAVALPPR